MAKQTVPNSIHSSNLKSGTVLSQKYEILRLIGKGGMGCVYEAREVDFDVDRSVAIKILTPSYIQDEKSLRRFQFEIKIAARLDHPNIVPIYYIGQEGDILYFVMKYLSGPTLREKIREQGVLGEKEARGITIRISDALDYMHSQNCIHRDIKSNNIIMDATGHPILMDFGIAKMPGNDLLTTEGEILGTATYMAPEQWHGKIDNRSDVYSFGCVMYEMATGSPPFISSNIPELMRMHLEMAVAPIEDIRSDLSDGFCQAILKCLAKDPDHRFQSMVELNKRVEELSTGKSVSIGDLDLPIDKTIAVEELSEIVDQFNPDPIIEKVNELVEKGRVDDGIKEIEKALKNHPENDALSEKRRQLEDIRIGISDALAKGENLLLKKEFAQAVKMLEKFLEVTPSIRAQAKLLKIKKYQKETDELFAKVQSFKRRKKFSKAKSLCREISDRDPNHNQAIMLLRELRNYKDYTPSKFPILKAGIGVAIFALILFILFVGPHIMPDKWADKMAENYLQLGNNLADMDWYRFPPYFNTFSCYDRANGFSNDDLFKSNMYSHWNSLYWSVTTKAQSSYNNGSLKKALSYYKVTLAIALHMDNSAKIKKSKKEITKLTQKK